MGVYNRLNVNFLEQFWKVFSLVHVLSWISFSASHFFCCLCLTFQLLSVRLQAEEKMRVIHDRKVQRLKHLVDSGAEAAKKELTRNMIRSLSTKIRIAIQVVDKISVTINKIRDEELWPQINELIEGYVHSLTTTC